MLNHVSAHRPSTPAPLLPTLALLLLLTGCGMLHQPRKVGSARRVQSTSVSPTNTITTISSEITQPEDPAQASSQFSEKKSRLTLPLPAASRLIERSSAPDDSGKTISTEKTIVLSAPTVQTLETEERYGATLGAAQKDDSASLAARFSNMRPVQIAGLLMILGAGALGYFTGRWKSPAIIAAAGLGLVLIAHLLVGHELFLLVVGLGASLFLGLYEAHIHNLFLPAQPILPITLPPAPSPAGTRSPYLGPDGAHGSIVVKTMPDKVARPTWPDGSAGSGVASELPSSLRSGAMPDRASPYLAPDGSAVSPAAPVAVIPQPVAK